MLPLKLTYDCAAANADARAARRTGYRKGVRRAYPRVHVFDIDKQPRKAYETLATECFIKARGNTIAGDIDSMHLDLPAVVDARSEIEAMLAAVRASLRTLPLPGIERALRRSDFDARLSWLSCRGACFHNDTGGHWGTTIFWVLVLEARGVDFVAPAVGAQVPLKPGRLIVFDGAVPHAVTRSSESPRWSSVSFEDDAKTAAQAFIAGEIALSDVGWRKAGCALQHQDPIANVIDLGNVHIDEFTGAMSAKDPS